MSSPTMPRLPRAARSASILLLVLMVVAVLSLCVATSLETTGVDYRGAVHAGRRLQAHRLAESGVEFLTAYLAQPNAELVRDGGLQDNRGRLLGVLAIDGEEAAARGRFSVVAPAMVDGVASGIRYGLENESSRLHLNALAADPKSANARNRLLALAGMTEEIADAILDWIDEDTQPRSAGAEEDYYAGLDPPYAPRNAPLQSTDELLLVRGVTPELLYGLDYNRNYTIDANETARGELVEADNSSGVFDRGWAAYLTVYSAESYRNPVGRPRVDVNGPSLQQVHDDLAPVLGEEQAKFIVLYRQYDVQPAPTSPGSGPRADAPAGASSAKSNPPIDNVAGDKSSKSSNAATVAASSIPINYQQPAQHVIRSLLDLVGTKLSVPGQKEGETQLIESPWPTTGRPRDALLKLYDHATASPAQFVAGRINVNSASRIVLATLPEVDAAVVGQIVARRDEKADPLDPMNLQRHAIWLLEDGLLSLEQMKKWEPYVTAGGDVYRGQVVGFFDAEGAAARVEIVIDRLAPPVQIVSWEDLQQLGPGFSLSALGAQADESR